MKVVQIGSNRGYDLLSEHLLSNYSDLEFGLFVEPFAIHMDSLRACYFQYSNIHIENIAIKLPSSPETEMKLYYVDEDAKGDAHGTYQVTSCKSDHITKHYTHIKEPSMKSFMAPCMTLDELFIKYNITNLDWLLLDIEGIDAEIVLSFDWDKYDIKKVEIEYLHLGDKTAAVRDVFLSRGYFQVPSLSPYDWAFEKGVFRYNSVGGF